MGIEVKTTVKTVRTREDTIELNEYQVADALKEWAFTKFGLSDCQVEFDCKQDLLYGVTITDRFVEEFKE